MCEWMCGTRQTSQGYHNIHGRGRTCVTYIRTRDKPSDCWWRNWPMFTYNYIFLALSRPPTSQTRGQHRTELCQSPEIAHKLFHQKITSMVFLNVEQLMRPMWFWSIWWKIIELCNYVSGVIKTFEKQFHICVRNSEASSQAVLWRACACGQQETRLQLF